MIPKCLKGWKSEQQDFREDTHFRPSFHTPTPPPSTIYLPVKYFPVKALLDGYLTFKHSLDPPFRIIPLSPELLERLCSHCSPCGPGAFSLSPDWKLLEGRGYVVFISVSSPGPPKHVPECDAGRCLLLLFGGVSSDTKQAYCVYLQKWLFNWPVRKAKRWHTPCQPCLLLHVLNHMVFLDILQILFFLNEPRFHFQHTSSGKKVFKRQGSFLNMEWLVLDRGKQCEVCAALT